MAKSSSELTHNSFVNRISLDWWSVILAIAAAAAVRLGWLPSIPW